MRRLAKWLAVLLGLAVALAAAGYLLVAGRGFSARPKPPRWEHEIAEWLRSVALPRGMREKKNPVPASEGALRSARAHYADHCAVCHAADGSGGTEIGRGLYPKVPDLRGRGAQKLADGEIFYIIREGVRFTGMPGFAEAPEDEDTETWELVHLLRRFPGMAPAEVEEIRRLMPRAPGEDEAAREMERFLAGEDH